MASRVNTTWSRCHWGLLLALFAGSTLAGQLAPPAGKGAAAPPSGAVSPRAEALRLAIQDLIQTFGARYPRGPEYLRRLAALEQEVGQLAAQNSPGAAARRAELAGRLQALEREALLANPLLDFDRLLLVKRSEKNLGLPRNWQGNSCLPKTGFDNEIAVLSPVRPDGQLSTLFRPRGGQYVGDLELHWNADRFLFSMPGKNGRWQVAELRTDGTGLRELPLIPDGDVDNYDACYLPDGGVIFCSTATFVGVPCVWGSSHVANLFRCEPVTGKIRQLTFDQDHNWCPTVLHDGRVLYQRWEYVDQSHSNSRILFHMNPDGTDQREFRGSESWFPGSFFYARPVPDHPRQVIGVAGGHHDVPRAGRLLLLDPALGRRDGEGIVQEIPGRGKPVQPLVRDTLIGGHYPQFLTPYPLSQKYHLVAAKLHARAPWGIYLADVFDNLTLIKEVPGAALLEPIPIRKTATPPTIPNRVDLTKDTCAVFISDLYSGPGLAGIPRGTVKKLRVVEYYYSRRGMGGLYGTLGMDGPWDVKRIVGTVPVEPDGSAHFHLPANTPITLQPLDDRGQAVQLMRSWLVGMPGEKVSCSGCHEGQGRSAPDRLALAARRAPSVIESWYGPARGFSFVREVQPVLDRYCVSCHDGQPRAEGKQLPSFKGGEPITDWKTQMAGHWPGGGKFTKAYFELQRFVRRPGIESDRRMLPPMDFHFSTTELGQILRKGHHGVALDDESWERLAAWADLNAPFYGTWGEIPYFDKGYGPHNRAHLCSAADRALELRKKYVPTGPFPDHEAIPKTPPYDTTPVKPKLVAEPAAQETAFPGWPFSAAEAVRRQQETAPRGSEGRLTIPLVKQERRAPVSCRYVHISAGPHRWLSLAEVQVFSGGRNVALGKRARQSSTGFGGTAERAVDGSTDGIYRNNSVTHTQGGAGEWWEVDLAAVYPVERIVLWNRTDTVSERLAGVTATLLDDRRSVVRSEKTGNQPGPKVALLQAEAPALQFAWIPPGEYLMGSGAGHRDERPLHRVKITRGYWISRFEITNEQYRHFAPAHESRTEDRHGYQFGITGYDQDQPQQPVVRVSWQEAMAFCRWLAARTGRKVVLPTEAQWEWACRAGAATPFWYGGLDTDFARFANLGDAMLAEFAGNPYVQDRVAARFKNPSKYDNWIPQDGRFNDGGFVTEPVGKYQANPWGLCDMHGNAAEWTRSLYRPYPYRDEDGRNSPEAGSAAERVVRGGSWYDRPFRGTASFRLPYQPFQRIYNVGFRIVIEE